MRNRLGFGGSREKAFGRNEAEEVHDAFVEVFLWPGEDVHGLVVAGEATTAVRVTNDREHVAVAQRGGHQGLFDLAPVEIHPCLARLAPNCPVWQKSKSINMIAAKGEKSTDCGSEISGFGYRRDPNAF